MSARGAATARAVSSAVRSALIAAVAAGRGGLHDVGGHIGDVARDPHPGGRRKPGGIGLDLAADSERVPGKGYLEVVRDRVGRLNDCAEHPSQHDDRGIPVVGEYAIDPTHSSVEFIGRHLMITKVRGRFPEVSGTITVDDEPERSHVEVELKVASLDTGNPERDGHLRSPDFFDALQVDFDGANASPIGDERIAFSAATEVDHEDWALTWNVAPRDRRRARRKEAPPRAQHPSRRLGARLKRAVPRPQWRAPAGGFMLLGGRAADLVGRRQVLVTGTVLFAGSSLTPQPFPPSAPLPLARRRFAGASWRSGWSPPARCG